MRTAEAPAAPVPREGRDEGPRRSDLRRALRYCLGVFLAVRIGLAVLGLAATAILPHPASAIAADRAGIPLPVSAPGWPAHNITPGWHNLVTSFERFDGLWFLGISEIGYVDGNGSAVFFPGYPMAIRAVSGIVGGHPLAAALLISNAALFLALLLLYRLTTQEFDERVARRAVLYLAVFPTAFFFLAPYSESLFLLLVVTAFFAARRGTGGWWLVAGLAGAGAALTRNIGVLLALPLAVEAIHQMIERRREGLLGLFATALVPIGTLAYLGFWQNLGGDWLAPLHQQATWQREAAFPWWTLWAGTREAFRWPGSYAGGYHMLDWLIVAPALVAAVWVARRTRLAYGAFVWVSLLAPLSAVFAPRPFMSLPRFLLPLFPLMWAAAVWAGKRRGVHEAVLGVSTALLGVLTVLFVNWYYVF